MTLQDESLAVVMALVATTDTHHRGATPPQRLND
jgi:hypothetical protein